MKENATYSVEKIPFEPIILEFSTHIVWSSLKSGSVCIDSYKPHISLSIISNEIEKAFQRLLLKYNLQDETNINQQKEIKISKGTGIIVYTIGLKGTDNFIYKVKK